MFFLLKKFKKWNSHGVFLVYPYLPYPNLGRLMFFEQVLPSFEAFLQDPQLEVRWSSRGRMSCVSPRILRGANLVPKIQWFLNDVTLSGGFWKPLILKLHWSDFSNLNFARCVWQPSSLLGSSRNASQFAGFLKQPKGAIFSDHQFC